MSLQFVSIPVSHSASDPLPPTRPESGTVIFSARPARKPWAQIQSFFHAIGARADAKSPTLLDGNDAYLINAWLMAHDIQHVVIRHADRLLPGTLQILHDETSRSGSHLILTEDDGSAEHAAKFVIDNGGSERSYTSLERLIAGALVPAFKPPQADRLPALLPRTDFPVWRANCRDLLGEQDFQAVDAVYMEVLHRFRDLKSVTDESVHSVLREFARNSEPSKAHTALRAAQAALFVRGFHMRIDFDNAMASIESGESRQLSTNELVILRAMRHPKLSAAMALFDAGLSINELSNLTIRDVTEGGRVPGVSLRPEAQVLLTALYVLRQREQAAGKIFGSSGRHLSDCLRRVAWDLNLPFPNVLMINGRKLDRWEHRLGLRVSPISIRGKAKA